MVYKSIGGLGLILMTIASCSSKLTPFTQDLYEKENWSVSELKRIQFYLSDDVVLRREMVRGESSNISEGKILVENGHRIEEIRIPANTPGVLLFMPKEDRFAVGFDALDDDLYLMFGPNPSMRQRYALLASEWSRNEGRVHYNGNLYDVDSRSGLATLMVDMKKTGTTEYSARKVSGRKIQ